MKSLKDILYESIMDVDSVDNQVENSVEWKERLETEAQKLTKTITQDNAWAYDVAFKCVAYDLFYNWEAKNSPEYNKRFSVFMRSCMNPWMMDVDPNEFDLDDYTDIHDVYYCKRGKAGVWVWMDECKTMLKPRNYQLTMTHPGSVYHGFFPAEFDCFISVVGGIAMNVDPNTTVKKYTNALKKLIEIAEL